MSGDALREALYLPETRHHAQLNQDIFALLMNRFRSGYFMEIGANDGFSLSNTLYLEEYFGWSGALIEANPRYMESLAHRKAVVVNRAIAERSGEAEFVDGGLYGGLRERLDETHADRTRDAARITVQCITLDELFRTLQPPPVIDFLSIDVEGADLQILEAFVGSEHRIRCGCVEMNHREEDIRKAGEILRAGGYEVAWVGQTFQDLFFVDPGLVRHC
jgi:FkbM family methyltransferase